MTPLICWSCIYISIVSFFLTPDPLTCCSYCPVSSCVPVRFSILSHAFRKSNFLFLFFLPHLFDSPRVVLFADKASKAYLPLSLPLLIYLPEARDSCVSTESKGDSGPSLPPSHSALSILFFSFPTPNTKSQSLSRTASFCCPLPPFFLTYCSLLSPDCSLFLSFIDHDV